MRATDVSAIGDYRIKVAFEDGVSGVVDLEDMVQKGIFQVLKDKSKFQNVCTDGTSIAWSDELEIDAGNIYAELLNAEPFKVLHSPSFHAAD